MEETREQYYSQYTFEQLGEAYETEQRTRIQLNKQLNDERNRTAVMKYDRDRFMEKYLMLHLKENMGNVPDGMNLDDEIRMFFEDRTRQIYFTPGGGYYCTIQKEDCVHIVFAWHNPKKWRAESKDMLSLIQSIARVSRMPLRYNGYINVMKNHSIEIEPGLYELKL